MTNEIKITFGLGKNATLRYLSFDYNWIKDFCANCLKDLPPKRNKIIWYARHGNRCYHCDGFKLDNDSGVRPYRKQIRRNKK